VSTSTILVRKVQPAGSSVAWYVRVSPAEDKENAMRQLQRLCAEAAARGNQVSQVINEVREMASGPQDEQPKRKQLRTHPAVEMLVMAHRNRVTRVDCASMATLLEHQGRRAEPISPSSETGADVVEDVAAVLTGMAARISGRRNSQRHAERSRACVEHVIQSEDV
jgi:predicted site-specific integrase-resolvase